MEIAIDSRHLAETVRLNFPDDRAVFEDQLLSSESSRSQLPAGTTLGAGKHLRIEGLSQEAVASSSGDGPSQVSRQPTRLALTSTIQFAAALQRLKDDLSIDVGTPGEGETAIVPAERPLNPSSFWTGAYETMVPRSKPLSPGELLGCTAPALQDVDALM